MKHIIASVIILILSNSFVFGIISFVEWNTDPACWDVGSRAVFAFISFFIFAPWIGFIISYLLDLKQSKQK